MDSTQPCPFCREDIPSDAERCPECGELTATTLVPKSDGIKIAGYLQMGLGGLAGVFTFFIAFGLILQHVLPQFAEVKQSLWQGLFSMLLYVGVVVFFVVTGLGATRGRRWVRPIMLSFMWPATIMGVISVLATGLIMPGIYDASFAAASKQAGAVAIPKALKTVMLVSTLAISFVMYVAIPGAFVAFYQRQSVRRLCKLLDPVPRWTDRCPVPVLAVSLWLGLVACLSPFALAYSAVPALGTVLSGWSAIAFALCLGLICAALSPLVYRLRPLAWWGTLLLGLFLGVSQTVTFLNIDLMDVYRAMDFPAQQLELMEAMELTPFTHFAATMGPIFTLALVGYMLYLRRFFFPAPAPSTPSQHPTP